MSASASMVGSKDTRRRAARSTTRFRCSQGARVLVVEIFEASEKGAAQEQVSDVVHYLVRHQVRADASVVPLEDGSGAKQLLRSARMKAPTCSSPVHMDIAVSASGCSAV